MKVGMVCFERQQWGWVAIRDLAGSEYERKRHGFFMCSDKKADREPDPIHTSVCIGCWPLVDRRELWPGTTGVG